MLVDPRAKAVIHSSWISTLGEEVVLGNPLTLTSAWLQYANTKTLSDPYSLSFIPPCRQPIHAQSFSDKHTHIQIAPPIPYLLSFPPHFGSITEGCGEEGG